MSAAIPPTEPARARTATGTQSLSRAVHLLRTLSTHTPTGWRLSDLAMETRLDHATVHRLLAGLVDERLAARVAGTRRYTLGPHAYELGVAASPYYALDRLAAPALARLATSTRDIVFLNVRSGFDSVCIARHDGHPALKAYTVDVGTRRPLCLSAGGVAMLVRLPRSEQARIEINNLEAIAGRDAARQHAMRRMVRRSRRAGYGINLGDFVPHIAAIGVALCTPGGSPVASISLAGLEAGLMEPRRSALLARLSEAATTLEPMIEQLRY
jgi:DNA-binding IclR family transcriptional regulator